MTSTCADRPTGTPPRAAPWPRPESPPPACTSRTSDGDTVTRIVTWLLGTVTAVTLLFGYHPSTSGPATTSETVVAAPAAPAAPQGTGSGTASTTGTTVTGTVV